MGKKAYDVSLTGLTGDKIMLFVNRVKKASLSKSAEELTSSDYEEAPIAFGTSCNVELTAETIDTTSKMSGNWQEFMTGQLGYTISSDSLVSYTTGELSYATLVKMAADRQPISFKLGTWTRDDETGEYNIKGTVVSGKGVITSISLTAGQGSEFCTMSFSMQGKGELTIPTEEVVKDPSEDGVGG